MNDIKSHILNYFKGYEYEITRNSVKDIEYVFNVGVFQVNVNILTNYVFVRNYDYKYERTIPIVQFSFDVNFIVFMEANFNNIHTQILRDRNITQILN
jgi:hypothetical protein